MQYSFISFISLFCFFNIFFAMERYQGSVHGRLPLLCQDKGYRSVICQKEEQKFAKFRIMHQCEDLQLLMSSLLLQKRTYEYKFIEQENILIDHLHRICPLSDINWNKIIYVVESLKSYSYDNKNTKLDVKHDTYLLLPNNKQLLPYIKKQLDRYDMNIEHFNVGCTEDKSEGYASPSAAFSFNKNEPLSITQMLPGNILLSNVPMSLNAKKGNIINIVSSLHKDYVLYNTITNIFVNVAYDELAQQQEPSVSKEKLFLPLDDHMIRTMNSALPLFFAALKSKKNAQYLQDYLMEAPLTHLFLKDFRQLSKIVTFWKKCEWVSHNILLSHNITSLEECDWFNTLLLRDEPFKVQLMKITSKNDNLIGMII